MIPEDSDILGLEEEGKKIKGIAEFSFEEKEKPVLPSILDGIKPKKKKELKIIVKDARRGKHTKGGKANELF